MPRESDSLQPILPVALVIDTVYVSRTIAIADADGVAELTIRVYAPRPRDRDHACVFEIAVGQDVLRRRTLFGADGLQSLLIALGMLVLEVESVIRSLGGKVAPEMMRDLDRFRLESKT
jgi:hypothetical protein